MACKLSLLLATWGGVARGRPVSHALLPAHAELDHDDRAAPVVLPAHAELDHDNHAQLDHDDQAPVVCRAGCMVVDSELGTKDPHSTVTCSCDDVDNGNVYRLAAATEDVARYSGKVRARRPPAPRRKPCGPRQSARGPPRRRSLSPGCSR